ncbi:shikimate dehydrogenase [Anianabacter salinae]|uniref:shikimate dehydrogenase n=1 Tax=Anianabacter salinae TaxID=2851023 RepID=UPI00225E2332|nr:shikimate dehydrogenase [Anianabacter salinae]MBV0912064.1 shikimate dehydrogenase [Anianabacter salinae]
MAMRIDSAGTGSAQAPGLGSVRVALIGRGIQKSRTPAMHRAEGDAQGLALTYELWDTDVLPQDDAQVAALLARAEAEGLAGLNVTFPYKKAVIAHLDELSDAARRVGAVNTIVFRGGRRYGHNTDLWGFAEGWKRGLPGAALDTVLLLGAGGAGAAVAHALCAVGAQRLLIADSDRGAAQALAADILADGAAHAEPVADLAAAAKRADGIVNATPMGMAKLPGTAIDTALLEPRHWVADIVYFPLETELLAAARARGCRTLAGSGMAVFQAVRAFELFTGLAPDPKRMWATFEAFIETDAANGG